MAASVVAAATELVPSLVKSAVDKTVNAVTTTVTTTVKAEIEALPKQLYDAATTPTVAEHSQSRPSQAETAAVEEEGIPRSQQLWNEAFDGLEDSGHTSGIVKSYADTLTYALADDDGDGKPSPGASNLAAELRDPAKRQQHMKNLVKKGRDKFADDSKIAQGVGDVAGFVLKARSVIDVAIQNVPQAALPWAGVCVGLQILTNPAKVSRSNLSGITHVVSRMDWYCSLVDHLLDERSIVVGKEPASAVMQRLEGLVLDLYKSLLLYQMKSVSSYYRNSGLTYLRELAALDDWEAQLKTITSAEEALRAASVQYNTPSSLERLSELIQQGDQMKSTLGNINQDLQDFIATQKQKVTDDKDSACLRDLFLIDPMQELVRLERKKDALIDMAFSWVMGTHEYSSFANWNSNHTQRLLWIKGEPGTGKTMLLIGIVRELSIESAAFAPNVAYYFCQGTGNRTRNNATAVLRALLWMLLVQQPRLITHLRKTHMYAGPSLFTDANAFNVMSKALEDMLNDPAMTPVCFIVDALDECGDTVGDLIQLIFKSLELSRKVRWLVSSRPAIDLTKTGVEEALVELNPQRLEGPVHAYITHKISAMRERPGYGDEALLVQLSNKICERSENTFLWSALAFLSLTETDSKDAIETAQALPIGLPAFYDSIMAQIDQYDGLLRQRCKSVLAAVYLAYRPLSMQELAVVANIGSPLKPASIVAACGSFLRVTGRVVSLVHQSARDYLEQNLDSILNQGDVAKGHEEIVRRSIASMRHVLRHNMYHLPSNGYFPRFLGEGINDSDNDPLAATAYSCTYWMSHLCAAGDPNADSPGMAAKNILRFLKSHFLRWVESLALLGQLPQGLEAIRTLQIQTQRGSSPQLQKFLSDAEKFLMAHRSTIRAAALQTYGSALLFTPERSSIREFGWDERLRFVRKLVTTQQTGDAKTRTLDGSYGPVTAVAFSDDGIYLGTGTEGSITVWRSGDWTPACTLFLSAASGVAEELSFSSDSKRILAVYGDAVHVCDIDSKQEIFAVSDPEKRKITCANFQKDSNDGLVIVFGDATVHNWDVQTKKMEEIFEAKGETKSIMALSPDNNVLAVSILDNLIGLWDVATGAGQSARVLKRHDEAFRDFTFAADSKTLGTVSTDGVICLWDVESGTCRRSFSPGWSNWPSITLSPDLKTIAMGGLEDTTRLLSIQDWSESEAQGHRSRVTDVVVAPGRTVVATASKDKDVRLWDIERGECLRRFSGHKDAVNSVSFSPDEKLLVSGSADKTVRLWNTNTAELLQTWKGHTGGVSTVVFSPDGKIVASLSEMDGTLRLWTVETGSGLSLEGHSDTSSCLAFSTDSGIIAAVSKEGGIIVWEVLTGNQLHAFDKGENDRDVAALAFSSSTIAVGGVDGAIYVLDKETGARKQLAVQPESFSRMTFHEGDEKTIVTSAGSVSIDVDKPAASLSKKSPQGVLYCYKPVAFPGMEGEARLGDVWIEGSGVLMLLPTTYASNAFAVCDDIVILGHASGRVTFLYFDFPKRPTTYGG